MKIKPRSPYTLSIVIAILATIASAGGLLLNGLYRENAFVTTTWHGNDAITLFLAVPILAGSLFFSVRGSHMCNWLGWVRWITCSTTTRSILLGLSIFALILGLVNLDVNGIRQQFRERTPVNLNPLIPRNSPGASSTLMLCRWQIEMSIRFHKSELALESARLLHWQARHNLLLIASLAHAFLLSQLPILADSLALWCLLHFCPRTGKRSRETPTPLYRLRIAFSRLWLSHPPPFLSFL